MIVDELLDKLKRISECGGGKMKVFFDTEAGCYDHHLSDVDNASIVDDWHPDTIPDADAALVLTNRWHQESCACKRRG